jgi:glycosyltransferase involved in cell wall biosynthesis
MKNYSIALVMIARNEATRIERALASCRPHVDRMLVLDTGSDDETANIARAAGADVIYGAWRDDFALARNAALDAAKADWHLVLDADEWIESGAAEIAALRKQKPDFVAALRVDSQYDQADGSRSVSPSWISRVLPGTVRYEGCIHEQPQHKLPVKRLAVVIGHNGYLAEGLKAKDGRNRALLEAALERRPEDAYLMYQLGKDHDVYERYAEAATCFARADAADRAESAAGGSWRHDLVVRWMHALKRCGQHAEALQLAEMRLGSWQDSPDFHFALGDVLLDWAAEEPDRAEDLLPVAEAAWRRCLQIGERPDLEGAVAGRGTHLAANNLAVLCDGTGRAAEAARWRSMRF